jgi:hypothetical protein
MRIHRFAPVALALTIASLCGPGPAAAVEVPIARSARVKALPAPVRKTVLAEGEGALVRGVVVELENGVTVYEVEMRIKGLTKDIVVGADGTMITCEQQVTLASLSPAVRATMVKAAGKRRIQMIESVTNAGKLEYYEAHVVAGKVMSEVKVSPDGVLMP